MKKTTLFGVGFSGILVAVIGVLMLHGPSQATSPSKSLYKGNSNVYLFGSIDPDGDRRVWALPAETATGITRQLAAKYPSKPIDGVIFYSVHSWRDIAHLAVEANKQQGLMIVNLFKEVERLKTAPSNNRIESKVIKLQEQLNEIAIKLNPR